MMVTHRACKLSWLIKKLNKILEEEGDIRVWVVGDMDYPLELGGLTPMVHVADNDFNKTTRDWSDTHTDKVLYIG